MFSHILIASITGSIIAMAGGILLLYKEAWAKKISLTLVSFAAGSLLGTAFFELIPKALESTPQRNAMIALVAGIVVLFMLEKVLRWYHCHDQEACEAHTFSSTVLIGDGIHNLLDGVAIAASFMIGGIPAGIATTLAVFLHEVPQEIGDFAVLLHAGYTKRKVFFYNLIAALMTPLGAIIGYLILPKIESVLGYVIAFTAGTFIYIAASDLIPEVHHRAHARDLKHVAMLVIGIALVFVIGILVPE